MGTGDGKGTADAHPGERITPEFVERGAKAVTEKDVEHVVRRADEIDRRFERGGLLGRFLEDGHLLVSLVKDYWDGRYRAVPFGTIAAITFTLLYVLNPFDLVPDFLPVIGQLDDVAVLSVALVLIERDLRTYQKAREAGFAGD